MTQRERDRRLLEMFLRRLEATGALSCPAADLTVAVDDALREASWDAAR